MQGDSQPAASSRDLQEALSGGRITDVGCPAGSAGLPGCPALKVVLPAQDGGMEVCDHIPASCSGTLLCPVTAQPRQALLGSVIRFWGAGASF